VGVLVFSKMGFGSCGRAVPKGMETKDIINLERDFGSFLSGTSDLHLLRSRSHRIGRKEPTPKSNRLFVLRG